jgi:phosphoenolpyruvate-protein kinase (PTS system EI component)
VVIRTFDIGRDKTSPDFHQEESLNPALGAMAVRIFLKDPPLLMKQIRAVIKANDSGNISLLFPMITTIEEIFSLKDMVAECFEQIRKEGVSAPKMPPLGIMVEVPAAIKLIPFLKDHIDFFSVGSNDLTQYLLAVDRNNSEVSNLYTPFHPAVVEALFEISAQCRKIGKPVTICGEMAGRSVSALMLLGMGFRRFSMNPLALMEIKRILAHVHAGYAAHVVRQIRRFPSASQIEEFLTEQFLRKYPDLFLRQPFF